MMMTAADIAQVLGQMIVINILLLVHAMLHVHGKVMNGVMSRLKAVQT